MTSAGNVKGFTLVELLIVLVIMSLLLSLVPPLMSSVMPSISIKAAANDLYHDIKYIRNMAVLNGRQTSITFKTMDSSYFSESKDNGSAVTLPADINIVVNSPDRDGSEETANTISFFADGSSSGATILLSTESRSFSIVVDWLTGRVSLFEGEHDEKV